MPSSSFEDDMLRLDAHDLRREGQAHGARVLRVGLLVPPVAVVTRSELGCSTATSADGFFSRARSISTFSGFGRENSFLR